MSGNKPPLQVIHGDDNYPTRVVCGTQKHSVPIWLSAEIERLQAIEQRAISVQQGECERDTETAAYIQSGVWM